MAWAEVAGSKAATTNDAGGTSIAATFGASIATGNLMWAAVSYTGGAGGHITGLSGGGTWTQVNTETWVAGPDQWLSLWVAVASSSGAHTVTASFNDSRSFRVIYIGAFTGNDASGTVDGHQTDADTSTATPSVTFTTTTNGDLLVGVAYNDNSVSATAGSGFSTATDSGGTRPIIFEWKEQVTAGAGTIVDMVALSGTPSWVICGAAFKAAAASATLEQEGFRWYEDNGSESGSSASAAQDTNITAAAGATKRLRMLVNATGDPATKQFKLQWRKTAGTWADVL